MMLSIGKIFWLVIILVAVWYLFKIIEKRKINLDNNMKKNDNESFYSDLMMLIKDNYLTYNCTNCGYSSKSHIWQCPSCNSWETIEPNTISDRVNIDG